MATIDVGPGATDRSAYQFGGYTFIDLANPANDSGTLTSVEVWAYYTIASGMKVGTFSRSGDIFTPNDYDTIGEVVSGAKRTFTVSIAVASGDYLGFWWDDADHSGPEAIDFDPSGGSGIYYKDGDYFSAGAQTYTEIVNRIFSIYATGETSTTSIKTLNGTAIADLSKWNGITIGSYKTINGISNVD